jgi:hypothetical protein
MDRLKELIHEEESIYADLKERHKDISAKYKIA